MRDEPRRGIDERLEPGLPERSVILTTTRAGLPSPADPGGNELEQQDAYCDDARTDELKILIVQGRWLLVAA